MARFAAWKKAGALQRQGVAVVSEPEGDDRIRGKGGDYRWHRRSGALVDHKRVIDRDLPGRRIQDARLDEGGLAFINLVAIPRSGVGRQELIRRRESLGRQGIRRHDQ